MNSDPNSSRSLPRTSMRSRRDVGLMRSVAWKGSSPARVCRFTRIIVRASCYAMDRPTCQSGPATRQSRGAASGSAAGFTPQPHFYSGCARRTSESAVESGSGANSRRSGRSREHGLLPDARAARLGESSAVESGQWPLLSQCQLQVDRGPLVGRDSMPTGETQHVGRPLRRGVEPVPDPPCPPHREERAVRRARPRLVMITLSPAATASRRAERCVFASNAPISRTAAPFTVN